MEIFEKKQLLKNLYWSEGLYLKKYFRTAWIWKSAWTAGSVCSSTVFGQKFSSIGYI